MSIVYNRETGEVFNGEGPRSGVYGQISMRRLCETLEECREISPHELITHLEINADDIRYRIEMRQS